MNAVPNTWPNRTSTSAVVPVPGVLVSETAVRASGTATSDPSATEIQVVAYVAQDSSGAALAARRGHALARELTRAGVSRPIEVEVGTSAGAGSVAPDSVRITY